MISAVNTLPNLGFDKLSLKGAEEQQRAAARALREKPKGKEGELTPEQQSQVRKLQDADRKVHAHERAHVAVGGDLVRGGANFQYTVGPDKKSYAVAGEVNIDVSRGSTPKDTIPKAQHIRATALAPVDPSPQDRSVASAASTMEVQARLEVVQQAAEEQQRAETTHGRRAVEAYQSAGGLEKSLGINTAA